MNYEYSYSTTSNVDPVVANSFMLFGIGLAAFVLILALLFYVYMAVCLMLMAKKAQVDNRWMAWIPFLNIVLLLQVAKKPIWWIVLMFVPIVNIVITVLAWMGAAKTLKKPEWLGILMIIPVANLVIPGYLAFSKESE